MHRFILLLLALLIPTLQARPVALTNLAGTPFLENGEWTLADGDMVAVSDPIDPGTRLTFDVITDKPGKQVWDHLRILLDYQDAYNHTVLNYTTYGTIGITTVRNGQRASLYKADGRGKPDSWHHVELAFTPEGVAISLDLRYETLVPWTDPAHPGRLVFACEGGAAGRVTTPVRSTPSPRVAGALALAPLFTDHAVLPHGVPVPVWGHARPGSRVSLVLDKRPAVTATADASGAWTVTLPPSAPGGPHQIVVTDGTNQVSATDLLFGEVWLCSGQSNMVWRLHQSPSLAPEIPASATYPRLRFFPVPVDSATTPQRDLPTDTAWRLSEPSVARHFSAIGQIFGRELTTALDLPVGIILAAKGGARIEPFMDTATLAAVESKVGPYDDAYRTSLAKSEYSLPSELYNAMIAPLARFPVTGFVWYQGESNAWRGWHYRAQLEALVNAWRETFPRETEPFIVVQLPRYSNKMDPSAAIWTDLREAQAQVAETLPGVQLAVTLDTGELADIHPAAKRPVAERIARLALRHVYGRTEIVADAPRLVSSKPIPGGLRLVFDRPVEAGPSAVEDFQLAAGDAPFTQAGSILRQGPETLDILARDAAAQPDHVRYAWKNYVKAVLTGPEGLPVAPFRTDTRPVGSVGRF